MIRRKTIAFIFITTLLLCGSSISSYAQKQPKNQAVVIQSKDTATLIQELLTDAQDFQRVNNLSQSLENYLRAIRILEKQKNQALLARTYEQVGNIYSSNSLYEKSIDYYLKADEIVPDNLAVQEELGDAYFQLADFNQAIDYYAEALDLCLRNGNKKRSLELSEDIVACYHKMENHEQALQNERIILQTAQTLGDSSAIATTFNNMGYAYRFLEDYKSAIQHFKKSLNLIRQQNLSHPAETDVLLNLSIAYQNADDYDNALKYLIEAIQLTEKRGNQQEIAQMYDLAASIYYAEEDYYNAQVYANEAIQLGEKIDDPYILRSSYLTSSLVNQQNDDFQKALEDYKKHLQLNDSLVLEERLLQQSLLQQQLVFERSERELQQLISEKEVSELARKQQELEIDKQKRELDILEQEKRLQAAELSKNQLEQDRAKQALLLTQKLLEAEKQEQQLATLRQKEALQKALAKQNKEEAKRKELELRAEKSKLEREAIIQEEKRKSAEAETQAKTRVFGTIALFFVVVIALILWGFSITRKKNKRLAVQQEVIKERNVELSQMNEEIAAQRDMVALSNDQLNVALAQITDSVRYAKRIQDSILMPPADIIKNFDDAFVFFQPRDIVSGDFYWYAKTEAKPIYEEQHGFDGISKIFKGVDDEKQVIAAVDCTGHGVPGAFMSLIGNDLLNDIVNLQGITRPDQILTELSKRVRHTLKQEQTSNQDGMDMSLCTINRAKKEVQFAGAKNCLVYIQNGELKQIKGDKMPIGGRDLYQGRAFTAHTVSIEDPTHFYIFSDGFQDQFGGEHNRKFMIKKFRQLLFEIHEKPMSEQREILTSTLAAWRGNYKQLDDVLVVGFKC